MPTGLGDRSRSRPGSPPLVWGETSVRSRSLVLEVVRRREISHLDGVSRSQRLWLAATRREAVDAHELQLYRPLRSPSSPPAHASVATCEPSARRRAQQAATTGALSPSPPPGPPDG